ncbi:MAG: ribosome biogenesis GTP-binding protein YihA/YsxC [Clostridia bacterium]|nr:ribosome biogenesis GTP-binding protein YihA/YsxC [Clostridia bacterium]
MNLQDATFEAAYGTFAQLPTSDLPEIAFSGRSNVGKSSLLNRLFNRKSLARVSSVPGKTVTINFYSVGDVRFVDLPGYGYAKVPKAEKMRWAEMMEGYFNSERNIRLVVQLVDMRHPPTKDDLQMLSFLRENNIPFVVALTKSDKLNKTEYAQRLKSVQTELDFVQTEYLIPFSAVTGEGREALLNVIRSFLPVS